MSIVYGTQNGTQQGGKAQPQAAAPAPPQVGVPPQMPQQYMIQGQPAPQQQQVMPMPPQQQQHIQQNYGTAQGYSIQPNYQMPQNPVQPNMPPPMPQAQLQQQAYPTVQQQQPMQVGNPGAMQMQQAPMQQQQQQVQQQQVSLQSPPANIHTMRNQQPQQQQPQQNAAPAAFVAGRKRLQQQAPQPVAPQQVQGQQQAAHQEAPQSPFSEPAPTVGNDQSGSVEAPVVQENPGTTGSHEGESQPDMDQEQEGGVPISHYGQLEEIGDKANLWMHTPVGRREEVEVPRPVFGVQYGQQVAKIDPEDGKYKVVYDPYTRQHGVGTTAGVAQQPTYGIGRVTPNNAHRAYHNREARRVSGALPFGAKYTNPQQIPTQQNLRGYIGQ